MILSQAEARYFKAAWALAQRLALLPNIGCWHSRAPPGRR